MNQQIITYTFDASAKTITFIGGTPLLEQISLITNVVDGIIIYQFNVPSKGGSLLGDVLTLEFDTMSMDDTDSLKINVDFTDTRAKETTQLLVKNAVELIEEKTATLDAFGRQRISQPIELFHAQLQYDEQSLLMEYGNTGTGVLPSWNPNTRIVNLRTIAGTGTSFAQSFEYIPYQAGRSQLILITGVIGSPIENSILDWGYFDANNGIFFRQNGINGNQFVVRSSTSGSPILNAINQSNWNIDKLDGTGSSELTLDVTKSQVLVIDFQFLSMGRVRIGFDIGGKFIYAHEFLHANTILSIPYMQTASLPVQMLITSTASTAQKDCYFKCVSVVSEGGSIEPAHLSFSSPESVATAGNGTRVHSISIRPKLTFNGLTNRIRIRISELKLLNIGNNPVFWELCIGQAFTVEPTWADINVLHSGIEYGTGGTLSGNPLIVIASGYVETTKKGGLMEIDIAAFYPITLDRIGNQRINGTLTLLVKGIGGTSGIRTALSIDEIR